MVQKDKSIVANDSEKLAASKNVAFKVCSVTTKAHNVDKSQLIAGVQTAPDGICEIVTKKKKNGPIVKAFGTDSLFFTSRFIFYGGGYN